MSKVCQIKTGRSKLIFGEILSEAVYGKCFIILTNANPVLLKVLTEHSKINRLPSHIPTLCE